MIVEISSATLTILADSAASMTSFYEVDLNAVHDQAPMGTLKLKLATCIYRTKDHDSTHDESSIYPGYQHVVVVAVDRTGTELISAGYKAALPCPPHCDGGKLAAVHFASYSYSKPTFIGLVKFLLLKIKLVLKK